jgi:hypothetical protein
LKRTLQHAAGDLHREEFYLFSDSLANPAASCELALAIAVHAATCLENTPIPHLYNPFRGRGNFFSTRSRVIACLAEQRQLPCILPPAGYNIHRRKDQHRRLPFSRQQHLRFKIVRGFILSQKKYPDP